jgi:hypothetical protein
MARRARNSRVYNFFFAQPSSVMGQTDQVGLRAGWLLKPCTINRSSARQKGQAVDVKQVGRELGVRYVLEGSVRKAGQRVRIG